MGNVDKTIRVSADASGASENLNSLRILSKKTNDESLDSLRENLKLLRQKSQLEEESARKRIRNSQEDVRYAERDLQTWRLQRDQESAGLKGPAKGKFERATREEETARRLDILRDKGSLADTRLQTDDERVDRKKQIKKLEELIDTTKSEGGKGRQVFEGIRAMASGSGGGLMRGLSLLGGGLVGGAIGLGAAIFGGAAAGESGLMNHSILKSQNIQKSESEAFNLGRNSLRGEGSGGMFGMNGRDAQSRYDSLQGASGGRFTDRDAQNGLIAIEKSTLVPGQSIDKLLNLGRYSKSSATESISNFDQYLKSTKDTQTAIIQLPEIIQSYLGIATEILNKNGRVDSEGLQKLITGVEKSYGVEGINIDRFTKGALGMATRSSNSILFGRQLAYFRKLHPNAPFSEALKTIENPQIDMEYAVGFNNDFKNLGGKGELGKILRGDFLKQVGLSRVDQDKIEKNTLKLGDLNGSEDATEYKANAKALVSGSAQANVMFQTTLVGIELLMSKLVDLIRINGEKEERIMTNAMKNGIIQANQTNKNSGIGK